MKKFILSATLAMALIACYRNPITGRSQLSLVSDNEMNSMALTQYSQFLSSSKVIPANGNSNAAMVKRVSDRLTSSITQYYANHGLSNELAGYHWETNLVESKDVNAWCMPGGKIVVYTGLLPITQNETALAIVMGHEIAHALAKHGSERMSEGLIQQMGGVALQAALSDKPAQTQSIFLSAYGVGSQLGVSLPHSRKHELEADKLGLMFAAIAGYDPREAVPFWKRMAAGGGQKPPEFLSTHPSDETRIAQIEALLPETMKFYTGK